MSQPSSSIISADNAEIKYKKALKEISKLIAANRVLRESSDKTAQDLKEKIDELSLRYEDLEKEYEIARKEKQTFAHYLDDLQKQKNNLERENAYLSDCYSEQTAQLRKMELHKDQKAIANLIRTYEEKEAAMKRNRSQNQDIISKLKDTIQNLQNQLQEERNAREGAEERYNNLTLELAKHKEMNSTLMSQNERLLSENTNKDTYCLEKERELDELIASFRNQITNLRSKGEEEVDSGHGRYLENYEYVLSEKNKMQIELSRLQDAYEGAITRQRQYFEMQEKMKAANIRADRAVQEANMLKNKIVVIEAKDFLEEAGDDDYDQKQFEERLNLLIAQNDPLVSLKNGEDTSHFRILKSFIVDLQDKIYKVGAQKKEYSKKYKSLKGKFVKTAEQLTFHEEQNKLLKGKLEGYERLTEKLQFQLQKSISNNEEQITRMTITSNNIITLKSEEYKATLSLLNQQLEMAKDKAERTEKNMKQENETLKLELDTLRIRYRDEEQNFRKETQLLQLYKKKNNEMSNRIGDLQEDLIEANQTANKYEELFKEEKGKSQGLVIQKQQLISQNKELTEQLDRKSYQFNENTRSKQDTFENQMRRLKNENTRLKEELEYNGKDLKNMMRELEDKRHSDQMEVEEIKRLNNKNLELEERLAEFKKKIREMHDENDTLKVKAKKYQDNYERYNRLEEETISKTDNINDLLREKLMLENDLKSLEGHLAEEKRINGQLQKQISNNKLKNLEINHDIKKEFENKLLESKKMIQTLNQDLADQTAEIREEKSKNLRLNNEVNNTKAEKARLQELMDQGRKKDFKIQNQLGNYKVELSRAGMEIEKLRNQLKSEQSNNKILNQQIEALQQKIFSFNQEISNLKMKQQTFEEEKSDLLRDLNSIKYHLGTVESYAIKLKSSINQPWEQQNFTNSLGDITTKIRQIGRKYGINFEGVSSSMNQSRNSNNIYRDTQTFFKSYAANDGQSSAMSGSKGMQVRGVANNASFDGNNFVSSSLTNSYGQSSSNFDQKIVTVESLKNGSGFDYTYSESKMGTNQAIDDGRWKQPSYNNLEGLGTNKQIEFNFSSGSGLQYIDSRQV